MKPRGHYNVGKNHWHYKHGYTGTAIYSRWRNIINRIEDPSNEQYQYYGARGIKIYPLWRHDFLKFFEYIESLPDYGIKGMTIDRINTNGNYEPGNLRWATPHMQCVNQRLRKDSKEGFVGIYCYKNRKVRPWTSFIRVNNKVINFGYFKTAKEAAIARNNYIIQNNFTEYKLNDI